MIRFNIDLIENYIKKHNLSKKEFCRLCGISCFVLQKIFKQQNNINIIALFKIAKVLGIKISEIFKK